MKQKRTLTFPEAFQLATNRVLELNGRSRRSEYWWIILAMAIVGSVAPATIVAFDILSIPLTFRRLHDTGRSGWWYGGFLIVQYASLLAIALSTGLAIMSMSFVSMSALSLIPSLIGWGVGVTAYRVLLVVFLCQDSDPAENIYGVSPKYAEE